MTQGEMLLWVLSAPFIISAVFMAVLCLIAPKCECCE